MLMSRPMFFILSASTSFFLACCCLFVANVNATSIKQFHLDELTNYAEFIFEGNVIAKESRWNDAGNQIKTVITFSVNEVIKGAYSKNTIELIFSGGEVDGQRQEVSELVYPEKGENGIYLVESLEKKLVNPLVGWSQGHYKINSEQIMMTSKDQTIMTVEAFKPSSELLISDGVAKGVQTEKTANFTANKKTKGLSLKEFKAHLKSTLLNTKDKSIKSEK